MRAVIFGLPGSGKTTLAKDLARKYRVAHIEADAIYWRSTKPLSDSEFRSAIDKLTSEGDWIFEGHLSKAWDIVADRADRWLELNPNRYFCFIRMLRRGLHDAIFGPQRVTQIKRCLYNVLHWGLIVKRQELISKRISNLSASFHSGQPVLNHPKHRIAVLRNLVRFVIMPRIKREV